MVSLGIITTLHCDWTLSETPRIFPTSGETVSGSERFSYPGQFEESIVRKMGHNANAFKEPQDRDRHTRLNFTAEVYGLTWSADGSSARAMMALLCAYLLIVFVHVVFLQLLQRLGVS
jgi:hypothetical protein